VLTATGVSLILGSFNAKTRKYKSVFTNPPTHVCIYSCTFCIHVGKNLIQHQSSVITSSSATLSLTVRNLSLTVYSTSDYEFLFFLKLKPF
jgi:uncharacterized protein (DUF2062 family)